MNHALTCPAPSRRRKRLQFRPGGRAVPCVIAVFAGSLGIAGCAPLMDAQSNLVTQARRGVHVAQSNRASSSTVYAELARVKRLRLDEAFDADAERRAGQGDLSPEWVVAARAAYAVALEAYAKQDAALRASDETAKRNLQAVDAALERLQFLQSIQNRWLALPREIKQQKEER